MFKENNKHLQISMLETTNWMNPSIKDKLEHSWAPIFYDYVFTKIDEKPFAVLYSDTGAPNFSVNILLSLELIKHMEDYSDDQLIEAFYFNYLVNYAVGIRTLGEINVAEKTLYNFRSRIYSYLLKHPDEEDLIFEQFLNLIRVFAEKADISLDKERMDTILFMSNIKKAGRLALAFDVLENAVKEIPEDKLTEALSDVLKPDYRTEILYRSKPSESESSTLKKIIDLCIECQNLIESLPNINKEDVKAFRILNRFIKEQTYIEKETGEIKINDKSFISPDSLQSAYDEDATYINKAGKGYSGYSMEIT